MAAEGSGEVDGPARLSMPIARLRRHTMMWAGAGPNLGSVLGEG